MLDSTRSILDSTWYILDSTRSILDSTWSILDCTISCVKNDNTKNYNASAFLYIIRSDE